MLHPIASIKTGSFPAAEPPENPPWFHCIPPRGICQSIRPFFTAGATGQPLFFGRTALHKPVQMTIIRKRDTKYDTHAPSPSGLQALHTARRCYADKTQGGIPPLFLWQGNPCGRRIPRRFPRPTGLCGAPLIRFPCRALTEHAAGAIQHCETGMQVKAGRKAIIRNGQSSMHLCTRLPIALQPQRFCLKPVAQMITHICKYAAGYPLARFVAKPGEVAGNPPFQPKAPA